MKIKMKKIKLIDTPPYNNYHTIWPLILCIKPNNYRTAEINGKEVIQVSLTKHQLQQVIDHYCGMIDCDCGTKPAQLVWADNDDWATYYPAGI